jgi:hypothetical protein
VGGLLRGRYHAGRGSRRLSAVPRSRPRQ